VFDQDQNTWVLKDPSSNDLNLTPKKQRLKLATYNILYGLRCNSKFLRYISADK
jgi:hypothetical protein